MRRPMLLMFVFSLCVVVKVHCDENIGPILNRMDDLSDEVAQVKRDLLRVEENIATQIDVAKIFLRVELKQGLKENVRRAFAEVLEGESVNEIVRSQVVSEVRQLKRGNRLMRRQLRHMHNSLRDMQKERDEYKDALGKTEKQSREVKCIIYPEETGRETIIANSFTQSHSSADHLISNSTKMSQDSMNTSVRNDQLTARLDIKTVQALNGNATREDMSLTNVKLVQLQDSLEAVQQELAAVNASISDLQQENMVTASRFSAMQQWIVQFENILKNTKPSVAFEVTQSEDPLIQNAHEKFKFDTVVLNNGDGYNASTGVFKAPVSGTYLFWANFLPVDGNLHAYLYKGDTQLAIAFSATNFNYCNLLYVADVQRDEEIFIIMSNDKREIHGLNYSIYGGVLIHQR